MKSGTKPSLQTRGRDSKQGAEASFFTTKLHADDFFCMKQKPERLSSVSWREDSLLSKQHANRQDWTVPWCYRTWRTWPCDHHHGGKISGIVVFLFICPQRQRMCVSSCTHSESSVAVNNSRAVKTLSDTRTRVQANVTNKHFFFKSDASWSHWYSLICLSLVWRYI